MEAESVSGGRRRNMLFMGTSVISGRGKAVVCHTGMDTELGRIAGALEDYRKIPRLEKRLWVLERILCCTALLIIALFFIFSFTKEKANLMETLKLSVCLIAAALPESLYFVITFSLVLGISRIARGRSLVRNLSTVEMLGTVQVICVDRRGLFRDVKGDEERIRPKLIPALEQAKRAGIRVVMLSDDPWEKALSEARELGILKNGEQLMRGRELSKLSNAELSASIDKISVYAELQPEDRCRIVEAWQRKDRIVAMTGSDIKDALSLKKADIGIAMGIKGTELAKNASDMILGDDSFATIIYAVLEGRRVLKNIRRTLQYFLSVNLAEILAVGFSAFLGFQILPPVPILIINLLILSIQAIALGTEAMGEEEQLNGSMKNESMFFSILYYGILMGAFLILPYSYGVYWEMGRWGFESSGLGSSMAFLCLCFSTIFLSLHLSSGKEGIYTIKTKNPYLFVAGGISILLSFFAVLLPAFRRTFGFAKLSFYTFILSILPSVFFLLIVELLKASRKECINKKHDR